MEYEWEMMIILWSIDGFWWTTMDITSIYGGYRVSNSLDEWEMTEYEPWLFFFRRLSSPNYRTWLLFSSQVFWWSKGKCWLNNGLCFFGGFMVDISWDSLNQHLSLWVCLNMGFRQEKLDNTSHFMEMDWTYNGIIMYYIIYVCIHMNNHQGDFVCLKMRYTTHTLHFWGTWWLNSDFIFPKKGNVQGDLHHFISKAK